MIITCIAIDDEPLALKLITSYIEKTPFLKLIGSYSNAIDALSVVEDQDVQLVFLDIHMPEMSGMEFSRLLSKSKRDRHCRIIFTTAYNQFAIEGYQVNALYYLLKPFDYTEFIKAATKGKEYFENQEEIAWQEKPIKDKYLYVKSDYKLIRIDMDRITYVESIKDYVKIHLVDNADSILSLTTLKSIEERLHEDQFLRVHRSFVVAIDKINALGRNSLYIGNQEIPVGDQYKEAFKKLIQQWG